MQTLQSLSATKKSVFQRQIPTILGLIILVIGLAAGAFFLADGPGVFAPRATPQTTPKNVKITNVTDNSFTVSFLTDEQTSGFVKYGKDANDMKSQASDDRDQLSGSVGKYPLHHITVRGLDPAAAYYFTIGTGSSSAFDDGGKPFTVTTAKRAGSPTAAKTIYGNISLENGSPADGSLVYVSLANVGEMSSLVKSSGTFAIPLSNARTADGSGYAPIQDSDQLTVTVQGPLATQTLATTIAVSAAQPIPNLTFGQGGTVAQVPAATPTPTSTPTPSPSPSAEPETGDDATRTPNGAVGGLANLTNSTSTSSARTATASSSLASSTTASSSTATNTASSSATTSILDLTKSTLQTVSSSQPIITGKAKPNVTVKILIQSENHIEYELVADSNGGFVIDVSKLENDPTLEPGEHTITYSYVDPQTNQEVTKTQTFYVKAPTTSSSSSSQQLALANTTSSNTNRSTTSSSSARTSTTGTGGPVPFGSGNPFPATGTSSAQASSSTRTATSSTRTSQPSTASGIPRSGSVETTLALVVGGMFFILAGLWSFWAAHELETTEVAE
jgi:hypothetical protein